MYKGQAINPMSRQASTKIARKLMSVSQLFTRNLSSSGAVSPGASALLYHNDYLVQNRRKITFSNGMHKRNFHSTIASAAEVMDSTDSAATKSYDAAQIQVRHSTFFMKNCHCSVAL